MRNAGRRRRGLLQLLRLADSMEAILEIRVAKTAGFCFGVKRAVDQVYEQLKQHQGTPIYTLGPIIHNEQVIQDMESKGVIVMEETDIDKLQGGIVIIRSHGVPKRVYDLLKAQQHLTVVDATCPFVKKIHRIVQEHSRKGEQIVIVGNRSHPEVQGILGWSETPTFVVQTPQEVECLPVTMDRKICIVSQTTFHHKKFQILVEKFRNMAYDIECVNTICNATQERQEEAAKISAEVDTMLVIGGRNSSNTQKLFDICKKECKDTYYIQTLEDFDTRWITSRNKVGITAGASTPKKIIEEVQTKMSEESFEQMLEDSLKTITVGEVIKGKVIDVKEDEIVLNIGYKADGIIARNEYTKTPNADLRNLVKVGEELEAKVLKVNDGEGQVQLSSRRLQAERVSKVLEEAFNEKTVLKATVNQVLTGGLSVMVDDTRVFIPASLVSDTYEKNLEKYAGQEVEFVITEFNPKKRRIIGDCKQLIIARKEKMKEELFARLEPGQTVTGTVKNVTDFGAFVDLGGADGLLHISEMSWGRVENPKKVFKGGEEIKVLVKAIDGNKIALSLKFPETNPWANAAEKYAVGNVVSGKVARMTDFGAFVELETGVDALLHVSQIAKEHIEKPSDVLSIGQIVDAKVVDFNADTKKISLSIKALLAGLPKDAE